jgi:hypothetical protein
MCFNSSKSRPRSLQREYDRTESCNLIGDPMIGSGKKIVSGNLRLQLGRDLLSACSMRLEMAVNRAECGVT